MDTTANPPQSLQPLKLLPVQYPVALAALAVIVLMAFVIQHAASTRLALLFITGTALGVVLYQ